MNNEVVAAVVVFQSKRLCGVIVLQEIVRYEVWVGSSELIDALCIASDCSIRS